MQKHTMFIVGIVGFVVLVGFITIFPIDNLQLGQDSLAGNVVLAHQTREETSCTQCEGKPVCAIKDQRAIDYNNACNARCNGATVIHDNYCATIPHASNK